MPKNDWKIEQRRAKVLETKLTHPEKWIREIAKEVWTSNPTVSRDLNAMKQDEAISQILEDLKIKSLNNASQWTDVEDKYIRQLQKKEELTSQEAAVLSAITKSNQQRYSFLQWDGSDDKGWEKAILNEEQLSKIAQRFIKQ